MSCCRLPMITFSMLETILEATAATSGGVRGPWSVVRGSTSEVRAVVSELMSESRLSQKVWSVVRGDLWHLTTDYGPLTTQQRITSLRASPQASLLAWPPAS